MGIYWSKAPQAVLDLAKEVIEEWHTELKKARIGFIMRSEAARSGGMTVLGQARMVSERDQVHIPFNFLIWLAADEWKHMTGSQRKALLDHELQHCQWDALEEKGSIRRHDLKEFTVILERHGYWWPHAFRVAEIAKQATLWEPDGEGGVVAVDIGEATADFLVQMERVGATD